MAESFGDVHCLLEHYHAKGDPGYPAHEADDAKDPEYYENNRS